MKQMAGYTQKVEASPTALFPPFLHSQAFLAYTQVENTEEWGRPGNGSY